MPDIFSQELACQHGVNSGIDTHPAQQMADMKCIHCMRRILITLILLGFVAPFIGSAPRGSSDFMEIYETHKDMSLKELADKGRRCMNHNQNDSALAIFTILASHDTDRLAPDERKYISEAFNSIGIISFMRGNYADAYSKFYSSIEYVDTINSPGYLNLAAIFWLYADYARCYEALKTELIKAMDNGHRNHAGIAVVNLANIFPERNLPEKKGEIIGLLQRFMEIQRQNPAENSYPLMMAQALTASLQGEHQKALDLYRSATSNTGRMLIPDRERVSAFLLAGNEQRSLGRPDSALALYRQAEAIARDGQFRELSVEVYKEMSDTYREIGDNSLALEYKYKHLELNDSLNSIGDFNKIRDLEMAHETSKFQSQLDTIKSRHILNTRTLWIVSVASLILAGMLVWVLRQNRALRRKNRDLFTMNLEVMEQPRNELSVLAVTQPETAVPAATETPKYAGSSLSDDRKAEIEADIRRVMADESNFCREGFTLDSLAELCGTNSKYISQVLNERLGKTFAQYLNEIRVDVARRRMVDFEHYGHLTLEAIVAGVGFKSRSTFSKTFKHLTGLAPSEFQKIARKHNPA